MSDYPYPSYIETDCEKTLWDVRQRQQTIILAMQRRAARNPLRDFLWRRPWRSKRRFPRSLDETLQWIKTAHDCQDPAVGCSCQPSFRFPPLPMPGAEFAYGHLIPLGNRIPRSTDRGETL